MAELNWDDLTSQAEVSGSPIPDGTYRAVVAEAEYKKSRKGDPQLVLKFDILDDGPQNGRRVTSFLTAVEGSPYPIQKFVEGVRAILGPNAQLDLSEPAEVVAAPFFNKNVKIVTEQDPERTYNGQPQVNVKDILPMMDSAPAAAASSNDAPPPKKSKAEPQAAEEDDAPPMPLPE